MSQTQVLHDCITPRRHNGYFQSVDLEKYLREKWPDIPVADFDIVVS